jgi:predicted DNA-binding transcriptional regulator AlpA
MADGTFPMSIPLGPKIKAWLEEEVEAWQEARMAQRKTGKGAF